MKFKNLMLIGNLDMFCEHPVPNIGVLLLTGESVLLSSNCGNLTISVICGENNFSDPMAYLFSLMLA